MNSRREGSYRYVRVRRREAKRKDSMMITVMSRREGLTDIADSADDMAACWYTPNSRCTAGDPPISSTDVILQEKKNTVPLSQSFSFAHNKLLREKVSETSTSQLKLRPCFGTTFSLCNENTASCCLRKTSIKFQPNNKLHLQEPTKNSL